MQHSYRGQGGGQGGGKGAEGGLNLCHLFQDAASVLFYPSKTMLRQGRQQTT